MLSISKPLSAGQAQRYHAQEFASEKQNYWSQGQGHTEWQGRLAEGWGLAGPVGAEEFARLADGEHPLTGARLVRHSPAKTYEGKGGKEITTVEHRAGWDATFSAPKSVSLTALVGGDERVREAHRASVRVALAELERYTEARVGGAHAPEPTGKLAAATFEHDTARPVEGYAAPQLHTHAVLFNVTERASGGPRALQPQQLFASQNYATGVYRAELALRLRGLGYEVERGEYGQPEIPGYTREYLLASSPRREQVRDHLRAEGLQSAKAAQIAAHATRDRKELEAPEEVLRKHRELAREHGDQAARVVERARERALTQEHSPDRDRALAARQAVTHAREHLFERTAVEGERAILTAALSRAMGEAGSAQVRREFARRAEAGEFQAVRHGSAGAGERYTTAEALRMEREILAAVREGNRRAEQAAALAPGRTAEAVLGRHGQLDKKLNPGQREAAAGVLGSRERIIGLDGVAGAGKTTTLAVIREAAEASGYRVEGFAPTSRAAQKLGEAGIETRTLQAHLARGRQEDTGERRLYVVDESSLASTRQMHAFLTRLNRNDRVLLVGDTRQHESVEAGRVFAQMQEGGMRILRLDTIVRQKTPELRAVVEQLARGETAVAITGLEEQGRVHEHRGREERMAAIAREYARSPGNTLVVSPDNRSRGEINRAIRAELQAGGAVAKQEHETRVLVPRQDLTGADRAWAARYAAGDVLLYSRGSKETGIQKGAYARVAAADERANRLTVELADGQRVSYDPRRQQGVSVYREEQRVFSTGDRVQLTAPARALGLANRELGTVERIDGGRLTVKFDDGRKAAIDPARHPHLDHGYAVTSHASQGQTADRVLIHVDTALGAKDLLNNRMAYVAVSRGALDAQLFTDNRTALAQALGRSVSKESAHAPAIERQERAPTRMHEPKHKWGLGR